MFDMVAWASVEERNGVDYFTAVRTIIASCASKARTMERKTVGRRAVFRGMVLGRGSWSMSLSWCELKQLVPLEE